ncbi:hypothetical protein C8J56DRAFT_911292, partial [Mycena floridula]
GKKSQIIPSIMLTSLPEELLDVICDLLIEPSILKEIRPKKYTHASPELRSLSLVNHRLRRICLPWIFSYLECRSLAEVERLRDESLSNPTIVQWTRTFNFYGLKPGCFRGKKTTQILASFLPLFESLSLLDLRGIVVDNTLMVAINCHPSLATVLISSFPEERHDSLPWKKLIRSSIHTASLYEETRNRLRQSSFDCGMSLACLEMYTYAGLPTKLIFSGLRKLALNRFGHDGFRFLSCFLPQYPDINQITFADWDLSDPYLPFLPRFTQAAKRCSLTDAVKVQTFTISPGCSDSEESLFNNWNVSDLSLRVSSSIIQVLRLTSDIFSSITSLTLLTTLTNEEIFHMDVFCAEIAKFPALRILRLFHTLDRFNFGHQKPAHPGWLRNVDSKSDVSAAVALEIAARFSAVYI